MDPDEGDDGGTNSNESRAMEALSQYLQWAVATLLEGKDQVSNTFKEALNSSQSQEVLQKFITDTQIKTILIERINTKDEGEDEIDGEENVTYSLSSEISFTSLKMNCLLVMKLSPTIESDKDISQQVRCLGLNQGTPYEILHAFVAHVIAPIFKATIKEKGKMDRDGDKMLPSIERHIAELEMGLLHLHQNIDIPEVNLTIHPIVAQILQKHNSEGSRPQVADFGENLDDSNFLNQLQAGVARWIREIQKVSKLDRDPSSGSALQEISFWVNLERALFKIQERRESTPITLTLDVLKHGKRFHATVSFDTDIGIKPALDKVQDYNILMKDFPLNDLLAATDLQKISPSLQTIFNHMRKVRSTKYPVSRALRLVEAISRDLASQILKVLHTRRLMHIPMDEFESLLNSCKNIFSSWEDEYEKLQGLLRDILKKKRDEHLKMVWRISLGHKNLQLRMEELHKFRIQHEQLRTVILRVLKPKKINSSSEKISDSGKYEIDKDDIAAIDEVSLAYETVKVVDALDLSKEGIEMWQDALKRYEDRIDRVETRITSRLRDQLGTAKNANEMFRIFSRFNALFVRPHIRGAIREYQTQLIQRVKEDIETLHQKFKVQYSESKVCRMSNVRDLPTISGSIIWAKQIDRQLTTYLRRVEDVLGKGWENHLEGKKLKTDGDSFRFKLDTQAIFNEWSRKVQQRNITVSGKVLMVETLRTRKGNNYKLKVNFSPDIIVLYKEVRNLKNLGFHVPLSIVNKAHQANQLYPYAISLIDSIKTYEKTMEKIGSKDKLLLLVAGMRKEIQTLLSMGMDLMWDTYKLEPYVHRLSEYVYTFQEKVDELFLTEEQLDIDVHSLDICQYEHAIFSEALNKIQKSVDDLSLQQYSNLTIRVQSLDEQIEGKLAMRLEAGIQTWTLALKGGKQTEENRFSISIDDDSDYNFNLGGDPKIREVIQEVRVTSQTMYMFPTIEEVRVHLMEQLFSWQAIVLNQKRIITTRYQVGLDRPSNQEYNNLLKMLPGKSSILKSAYSAVESVLADVDTYAKEWLQYQALWDLQSDTLYGHLGEDVELWMQLLQDIKKSRATFDTSETRRSFGPVVVSYARVQSKVSVKYDSWHKDVLSKFGQFLGNEMSQFYEKISKSRTELEQQSIDAANTSDAVMIITFVQSLKRQIKSWEKSLNLYKDGQRILERQRFNFPTNWLHFDNIDGEWGALNEIVGRKDSSIQTQVASLQMKIVAEDKAIELRTSEYLQEWESGKPVEGNLMPDEALQKIQIIESKFKRLKDERANIAKAKEALELQESGNITISEERMIVACEELDDLKGVWSEMSKIWKQIEEIKDKPWLGVQPRKLRSQLDQLLTQLKDLPARLRQYASYEHIKKLVQGYTKVNVTIIELKSDALKERHWKQLMRQLRVNWVISDLTLGQVWDVDLRRNESIIREIIIAAQGEMALEEFLKQVKESWQNYELELTNYQNKCKIIRGWDDLFNKVKEHINAVSAMKLSPYYREFEDDALYWEEKLNKINALFDIWIDVQRRWVYLDGIFSGSSDIKALLPVETSRFASISTEFLNLMKRVTKSPLVLEILNIQGGQKSLERLADLLNKIQKALGEYLERERSSFPRFYFVGDEDLLEIIGNSKNIPRLQKHFKKMFAGVSSILLNEDNTIIKGIASREGEEVVFNKSVSTIENPKINDWLALVESEMRMTLAQNLAEAVQDMNHFKDNSNESKKFMEFCDKYPSQIIILSAQIAWSEEVENTLKVSTNGDMSSLQQTLTNVEKTLNMLADSVLQEQPPLRRKKLEHLINEYVHKKTVTTNLLKQNINDPKSFTWLKEMRFYFDPHKKDPLEQLSIYMANAKFNYGFEYLGVAGEVMVQTPLIDRCFLTMTQALEAKMGGSPFGPAGTGKTESVKALGSLLGKFVLVFNCDENFDFQSMGRIFVGLCQVGAWGCFDEFNRLEERMLSAVSQQIQTIQEALKAHAEGNDTKQKSQKLTVELVGKQVKVSTDMAIFITMNPTYAGRSNLPDNLKKLFRSLAMTKPDRQLIVQVTLFSHGFRSAAKLARKVVPFFKLCAEQLSDQSHYDFGLRALKAVLASAGNVKRERIQHIKDEMKQQGKAVDEGSIAENLPEQEIIIQSICEIMVPKLVAEDIPLLFSLLSDIFPGIQYTQANMAKLKKEIMNVCNEKFLSFGDNDGPGKHWMEKVLQLYQISQLNHGLMMVGPSGSGKTSAWQVLLKALERFDGVEGVAHVIDPKAISKESLYGSLDPNTREWTDGLFTHAIRKIIDNVRGEINKRQWIIFDGDVDPEWVENLNSVLDESKLLTLPNGERLAIPPNVRIMFEVQDLKYATLATVSRCGMVWFSEQVLSVDMIFESFINKLRNIPVDNVEQDPNIAKNLQPKNVDECSKVLQVQRDIASILSPFLTADGLVVKCLDFAFVNLEHIMDFTRMRALSSLFALVNQTVRNVLQYNETHDDFPMQSDQMESYIPKSLIQALLWSFSGDGKLKYRIEFGNYIRESTTLSLPPTNAPIIDYEVNINGEWVLWSSKVPTLEIETHRVAASDLVVPTVDTVRHESLLYTWLAEHKPLVLCGPPGSGKTMTLFSALRALPDLEVVGINFSSATTPELILKTFEHYCEYRKTPNGVVLSPVQLSKWLVIFCDEINLPDMDKYGTQRVISFIRQLVERGGFYRTSDHAWVKIERIQFVGACNPPTDPGRKPLSHRFLRHVPVVYVDYPGEASLKQIYGTFNRAALRKIPALRAYAEPLTNAMVEFFLLSQDRFTQEMQPHYVYSPREMTRWVRGIHEAIGPLETLDPAGLVRLWAHEALRLFHDRLVFDEERKWTNENIDAVATKYFPNVDNAQALQRPILYSNWITKDYVPVKQEELREFTKARLKVFYEEELDVKLVLFNEVLDHVLRIDRIFRQPQGHLLLIGASGAGKTTLSKFVAWMNGLSIFQIKVHNKYTMEDFNEDLRNVLRRSGCKDEKICFILDESNVLDSSFLESMNTLLANGEVPGLFEGDEYSSLMTQCKEASQRAGRMLDGEELYKWFTMQVMRNLHVVFTMNPSTDGLKDRAATSPALFNRCVLNWFGDWSNGALFQVGKEFTVRIDLDSSSWSEPDFFPLAYDALPQPLDHRAAVVNAFVHVHQSLHKTNVRLSKRGANVMAITPRHYLDFISHFVNLYNEKCSELEDQQLHLNVGLAKIAETVKQVEDMQKSLAIKNRELQAKNDAANAKLKEMVGDQQEAEKQKVSSEELQAQLKAQTETIRVKREDVMRDLSKVEPAIQEAQNAVKSIKRQHLNEVKVFATPPPMVKLALESMCLLLGKATTDWKAIKSVIIKDSFINDVINFDTDSITPEIRKVMQTKYLSNPDFNFEKVNYSSKACGPMVKWALAQIEYSNVLSQVEPLRNELKNLEAQADENKNKYEEVRVRIQKLESSIAAYKDEYAELIASAQAIKTDLESVKAKVDRSMALIKNLSIEQDRWALSSDTFKSQMSTIMGDVLLSSGFIAYAGYFDQHQRQILLSDWCDHLEQANIQYRRDIARIEYLSNPDERLRWLGNNLPADDLCTENAIMIKRFNRYPLIIDPSGQAVEFVMNEYKEKKITKTSFLDDSFRKNLESALRFGNPLLVQDVENYDPILNPVLNREVRRSGGRVLITLGDQDIDISPAFTIILSTRDPTVEFPPDICSRVTFVNFTVTRSSLRSQCLNQVLKSERPDIDEKRSNLLKIQGEFQLRLRVLEKDLLQVLNDSKGQILDDDSVISTLELLKKEAQDISLKVEETNTTMKEIEEVSQQYFKLSMVCSSIYFTLDSLHHVHFLYHYSLHFFLDSFHDVLNSKKLKDMKDYSQRLSEITKELFLTTYKRVACGMLHKDRLTLAVLLSRIHQRGLTSNESFDAEFQHLLYSKESVNHDKTPNVKGLSVEQTEAMLSLSKKIKGFNKLEEAVLSEEFQSWLITPAPEKEVPRCWELEKEMNSECLAAYNLLVIQAFRPDRLCAALSIFVTTILGTDFLSVGESDVDMNHLVETEVKASIPILMCGVQGIDTSTRVEDLASENDKHITSIAIGSAEGFTLADKAINTAIKNGTWVMLKNVHLAPSWLIQLEKKLHSLNPHNNFRLFLTMEINPRLPVNLLRAGRILAYEPPPGIRANLLRTFSTIPSSRMMRNPSERARLYFLIAWFHAITQERLRYAPLGWSKQYEFTESDLRAAFDTVDTWVDATAMGRTNLPPDKIPWDALSTLLSQCIYGGKIDNEFDQRLLTSFLDKLFTSSSYNENFPLISDLNGNVGEHIVIPEGSQRSQFLRWIEALTATQTPSWLGLPNNAEMVLLTTKGSKILSDLFKMQSFQDDEEESVYNSEDTNNSENGKQVVESRPAWMTNLEKLATSWILKLPEVINTLRRTADNVKDPLYRYFEREVKTGSKLLSFIRNDLKDVILICKNEKKQTNYHRSLVTQLMRGMIPDSWQVYTIPKGTTVIQWFIDFVQRIQQLKNVSEVFEQKGVAKLKSIHVWLGGLFNPEAYITATRQYVAQINSWSLEELNLDIHINDEEESCDSTEGFIIKGLKLEGAICKQNVIHLSNTIITELSYTRLKWINSEKDNKDQVSLPVYLNSTRSHILFTADFTVPEDEAKYKYYERGVAFLASNSLS